MVQYLERRRVYDVRQRGANVTCAVLRQRLDRWSGDLMQTLTERDLAKFLRCSVACLRRMRREGRGPRWTRIGRLVRYPESWVQEYLNSQSRPSNSAAGN